MHLFMQSPIFHILLFSFTSSHISWPAWFYLSVHFTPLFLFFFPLFCCLPLSLSPHKTLLPPTASLTSFLPPSSISSSSHAPSLSSSIPSPHSPKHDHLACSHSRSLHFSAHEICLTISGSAQGQIREARRRKPQLLFLSSFFPLLFLLTAFELSLQHIIIITEDGNIEIRMLELK